MELAGRTLTVDVGRVAAQANGAAFMHYGDTVVLSTATASEKPRDGIDFFPCILCHFDYFLKHLLSSLCQISAADIQTGHQQIAA